MTPTGAGRYAFVVLDAARLRRVYSDSARMILEGRGQPDYDAYEPAEAAMYHSSLALAFAGMV